MDKHEQIQGVHTNALLKSSWYGLKQAGEIKTASDLIVAGEQSGAWPVRVGQFSVKTVDGKLDIPREMAKAVVGEYADGSRRALGMVGDRYTHTTPAGWRELCQAAVEAGARPTGAFALRGGARLLATFEVGQSNGILTNLAIADAFDGSLRLTCGMTAMRFFCANQLASMLQGDEASARIRHTSTLPEKIAALAKAIDAAVKEGCKIKELYHTAEARTVSRTDAEEILARLFPAPAEPGREQTRALNLRADALRAAERAENQAGSTLATLWNAATWLVDRTVDGQARAARGGADKLDSLLFGTRGKRVEEIRKVIEVVLADGSLASKASIEAHAHGIDDTSIGRAMLTDMLG
jgi:hypothetical protein